MKWSCWAGCANEGASVFIVPSLDSVVEAGVVVGCARCERWLSSSTDTLTNSRSWEKNKKSFYILSLILLVLVILFSWLLTPACCFVLLSFAFVFVFMLHDVLKMHVLFEQACTPYVTCSGETGNKSE